MMSFTWSTSCLWRSTWKSVFMCVSFSRKNKCARICEGSTSCDASKPWVRTAKNAASKYRVWPHDSEQPALPTTIDWVRCSISIGKVPATWFPWRPLAGSTGRVTCQVGRKPSQFCVVYFSTRRLRSAFPSASASRRDRARATTPSRATLRLLPNPPPRATYRWTARASRTLRLPRTVGGWRRPLVLASDHSASFCFPPAGPAS